MTQIQIATERREEKIENKNRRRKWKTHQSSSHTKSEEKRFLARERDSNPNPKAQQWPDTTEPSPYSPRTVISSKSSTPLKPSARETPPSASAAPTTSSSASRRNPPPNSKTPGKI